jgi:sugar phosphate isomerase/epimerase
VKLAIEFVGASTRRMNVPHDFIHTIDGVRSLVAAADLDNHAGLVIDSYHWTASGGSILDIMHLDTDFILYVELNDGSARYDIYTLPENSRELPLTTGIVNAEGLLEELTRKHYNGPICIEPWNEKISQMPPEDAVKLIKNSIDDCMRIVTY